MTLTPQLSQLLPTLSASETDSLKAEVSRQLSIKRLFFYQPYPKQAAFHELGATMRERLFMAGNQLGKTLAGSMEAAYHATGLYPEWWKGRRFDRPTNGWASGVTSESTRDNPQRLLMGRTGHKGTGALPLNLIVDDTAARGVADAIDTARVKHVTGGLSTIGFKSYEKGREKWQGETLDWIWFDEEPPLDIYTEGLTRTNIGLNPVWITFTPLLGMSAVVERFLMQEAPDRSVTKMTIEEALHYTQEQRAAIINSYLIHEREARAMGVPMLGSGRVFPVAEELLKETAIEIPKHWPRITGIDFGWDHPTAAAWLAWDRDSDCVHLYDVYRQREATPVIHAAAINARGKWPVAWPHDGLQHDKGSGLEIAKQYRDLGCNMLQERATFEDGESGVEAGLMEMLDRMQTGRFKVAAHLNDFWDEYRMYHRVDGRVVKDREDIISACRYAVMMKRHADVEKRGNYPKPDTSWVV